ncbi:zinc finger MYM-type protein 1 [Trichonephila clavipes]|nr:zinc finger MYM-type protein 1 [Trichonephila clavipes]
MQYLDCQQPSEKDIAQPENVSNDQTEKCLENVGGLAFRCTDEVFGSPHNGSFIRALELRAEFDPFIREHIEQRELRQQSLISYLSKTIYEQIIEIMGKHKSLKQLQFK